MAPEPRASSTSAANVNERHAHLPIELPRRLQSGSRQAVTDEVPVPDPVLRVSAIVRLLVPVIATINRIG